MSEEAQVLEFFGIPFNVGNCLSGLVSALVVFLLIFFFSRKLTLKPTGKQNMIEWMIDFTNGIVKSAMPDEQGKRYGLLAFTLFLFIFVSNQIGLAIQLPINGVTYIKSPTASPATTFTLAFLVLVLAHGMGISKFGFKGYVKNSYFSPMPVLFPMNLLEQFTNFLTLALRLYGNIFSGEVLLTTIYDQLAKSNGLWTFIPAIPLEIIWQAFSVFIGSIQAYVFVTLTMVYISQKVEKE